MKKLLYSYAAKSVVFYEFCNNVANVQNFRGEVKFFSNYFRKINKSTYSVIHLLLLTSVFWKNLKQEFYYIYYVIIYIVIIIIN